MQIAAVLVRQGQTSDAAPGAGERVSLRGRAVKHGPVAGRTGRSVALAEPANPR
jgi:hypothetical protein